MGSERAPDHEDAPDRTLDAVGLLCPEPLLRARAMLSEMEKGELLDVLTDDPMAELDFQVFCDRTGHALVSSRTVSGVLRTRIRRRSG